MRKLFTLTLALLASFSLWAETVTFTAAEMSEKTTGVKKGVITAFCPTKASDQQAYKSGSAVKHSAISLSSSADTAVIVPASGKSLHFRADADYKITGISIFAAANKDSICGEPIVIWTGAIDHNPAFVGNIEAPSRAGSSDPDPIVVTNIPDGATAFAVYRRIKYNSSTGEIGSGSNFGRSQQTWNIFSVSVTYEEVVACTPDTKASFEAASTELTITDVVANPSTTLTFTKGDNKSDPTFVVTKGGETTSDASVVGTTFSATAAGTYIVTATQAVDETNNICEVIKQVTITVTAQVPVTACSIEGPTAGYAGYELTYTATAANATAFAWYVDDALQEGETDAEFVYTGVKGNHSIYATATNAYTATPVASDPIDLTVTKLCGMLIKATHKKATTADIDPASVVGGTVDKNTQDGGKLGSNGHYFGVKLASGSFMAGDVVTVVASTLNGGNTATLFSDKGTHSLGSAAFDSESKTATITLTESTTWIYLYRVDGEVCNPTMGYISVTRSCEDSDDASVKSLTVNDVAVAKDAESNKFEYTVSTNYAEENVTVAFTIHPLATSDKEGNTFTIPTPSAGDTNGASFKVTAEDGTQVTYTVFITKAASLSDDATLKALSVEGYEISPAFDAETTAYTITKAYGAETPAVGKVTATPNDANANAEVVLAADVYTITVTAEDGETKEYYYITVNTADAKKDLLEASFSNGANGYILNGNIQVPYLAGTSEPTFTAARFWNADGEPTAEIVDGKLVVTGADAKTAQYTIEYVEVTPMEASYDLITFTEVPSYIFSVYGWASDKGVKFSKDVEETSNHRISEGKDRIYIALPAAKSVILTGGSAGARPIKVTVNGVVDSKVTSTPAKDETITISLNQSEANFIGIESNGNNGDAGFTKMQLVQSDPTALNNTADEIKAVKFVENGQLFIRRGEKVYTITGEEVK